MQAIIQEFIQSIQSNSITFQEVLDIIEEHYQHTPVAFNNGAVVNLATQNQGSARVFGFGKKYNLSKDDTLQLFAEHYAQVLQNPEGEDHQNIRQFMIHGWDGVHFIES